VRRLDVLALGAVAVLVAGAFAYGQRHDGGPPPDELAPLRAAAALAPCPSALTPDLEGVVLPCLGGGADVEAGGVPSGPTLVNVWGTWCGPCVREVPELVEFAERAQDRVAVVGVLTTDTERNGLLFAEQYGMRYANVVDADGVVRSRYGAGAPITLLVDAAGRVAHVERGEIDSVEQVEALVAEHLGVRL
jgi:cytochrome c biogenesis protein CcmG/thiol:disulfide interchange protein DsbE